MCGSQHQAAWGKSMNQLFTEKGHEKPFTDDGMTRTGPGAATGYSVPKAGSGNSMAASVGKAADGLNTRDSNANVLKPEAATTAPVNNADVTVGAVKKNNKRKSVTGLDL